MLISHVNFGVCEKIEAQFRDSDDLSACPLPPPIFYSLRLHQINAFGYRAQWAASLLPFVKFDSRARPYFPVNPETPEAHRHKFLCALALSEGSPGFWQFAGRSVEAKDFVEAILLGPTEDWGDHSVVPEPSWTLQFLSAFLDTSGNWDGSPTPLISVMRRWWNLYFEHFNSGILWSPGLTPFTETGLHFLEAVNKLCRGREKSMRDYVSLLHAHVWQRLEKSLGETEILLGVSDWTSSDHRDKLLEIAISQLLVLGHLLELSFHPNGILKTLWSASEKTRLDNALNHLASLALRFFDARVLALMSEEQRRSYPFPLLHAYHALQLRRSA